MCLSQVGGFKSQCSLLAMLLSSRLPCKVPGGGSCINLSLCVRKMQNRKRENLEKMIEESLMKLLLTMV